MKRVLMIKMFMLSALALSLVGCNPLAIDKPNDLEQESSPLIDLVDSTAIIRTFIAEDKLKDLLENPEEVEWVVNNISPAEMAFETEVLATTVPMVVVYYFKEGVESGEFIKKLREMSWTYDNKIKFVIIDVDKLFYLAQDADIEETPALLVVKDSEIVERIESDHINIVDLEKILSELSLSKESDEIDGKKTL